MAQSEYKYIKPGDWRGLRYSVNRINERLSKLDGFSGTSNKYSDTNMMGHQILNGPPSQENAEGSEFITKGYLKSKDAALVFSRTLGTGGVAPLVLSPSLPGSQTIAGGGAYNPNTVIYGGGAGSSFTDFRPSSGMWMPKYNGNTSYVNMSWGDGSTDDWHTGENGPGQLQIISNYGDSVQRPSFVGVKSRFRLYPDANGEIEYQIFIQHVSFSTLAVADNAYGWVFGVWPSSGNSSGGYYGGFGIGVWWPNSNELGLAYAESSQNNLGTCAPVVGRIITSYKIHSQFYQRMQYRWATGGGYDGPRFNRSDWFNGVNWVGFDYDNFKSNLGHNIMNGISVFLGMYTDISPEAAVYCGEFRLNKGIAYLGASNDTV